MLASQGLLASLGSIDAVGDAPDDSSPECCGRVATNVVGCVGSACTQEGEGVSLSWSGSVCVRSVRREGEGYTYP